MSKYLNFIDESELERTVSTALPALRVLYSFWKEGELSMGTIMEYVKNPMQKEFNEKFIEIVLNEKGE